MTAGSNQRLTDHCFTSLLDLTFEIAVIAVSEIGMSTCTFHDAVLALILLIGIVSANVDGSKHGK